MKKNKYKLSKIIMASLMMVLFMPCFASADTLQIHPTNSRYFTDGSGKAIYLTGSHTWTNLQDIDLSFDYDGYLDFMEENNHNFMRMWRWELFQYTYGDDFRYCTPQPWRRTGPEQALDGRPKFDLTSFDEEYFSRLRSRIIAAGQRDIYVSIMLFEGHGVQRSKTPWSWNGHPFNAENNINGIDGNPNGDDRGLEIHTLEVPAVTNIQKAYVRKVIDTVNDLDNVLYEIGNECFPGSTEWQYHMINYIKNYEATKPKQHPVGMTFQYLGGTNTALFDSPADWISPQSTISQNYKDSPPAADGSKVIIPDTDHLGGIWGNQQWVWKSFLRGLNPIYMDPYGDTADETVRDSMGYTLEYAKKMNLVNMVPRNDLSSTGYCLANPGSEYLIYQPISGSFTVELQVGTYNYEWFNPDTGVIVESNTVTVNDGSEFYIAPFSGDAVLYLWNDTVVSQTTIDNGDSGTSSTGDWQVSGGADPYGTNSLYNKVAGSTYTFTNNISGNHEISLWWTEWASRSNNVAVEIRNGSTLLETVHVNQQNNGGQWNKLGTYDFSGTAKVTIISSGNNTSTCADAVKFEETVNPDYPSLPANGIIDNEMNGTDSTGNWSISGGADPYGTNSLWSKTQGGTYSWAATLPSTGDYTVSMWWTEWPSRITNAPVRIYDGQVLRATVNVNQMSNGGQWNLLQTINFTTNQVRVEIESISISASTCADAVKFEETVNPDYPSLPANGIIDNEMNGTDSTGNWSISGGADPYGTNSLWSKTQGGTYSWAATLPSTGDYTVSMWWTEWPSRITNAPVRIYDGQVLRATVNVNQMSNGGQWNLLQTINFTTNQVRVEIESISISASTCADAVKIE